MLVINGFANSTWNLSMATPVIYLWIVTHDQLDSWRTMVGATPVVATYREYLETLEVTERVATQQDITVIRVHISPAIMQFALTSRGLTNTIENRQSILRTVAARLEKKHGWQDTLD